jgi:hypothetical protein
MPELTHFLELIDSLHLESNEEIIMIKAELLLEALALENDSQSHKGLVPVLCSQLMQHTRSHKMMNSFLLCLSKFVQEMYWLTQQTDFA